MSAPLGNQGTSPVQYATATGNAVGTADDTIATLLPGQRLILVNCADAALYVKYGTGASNTDFTFIMPACTAQNDGTVPPWVIDDRLGTVSVAAASGTARYVATVLS